MGLPKFRPTTPGRATDQRHVAAIILTELTINVAFSCVDDPIAELNESLWFNFVSLVMPMTSTF